MATPLSELEAIWPRRGELFWLVVARAAACFAAYESGFRALSDDDYARISIAQRFAEAPHFDPSGTSWLPAPFWLYGSAFRVFGPGLGVARALACVLAVLATILVYAAARLLGAGRRGALLGATLSSLFPYSALLGIAAVPEVPTAALVLFGAATLAQQTPRTRSWGGVALTLACASRYEAWPVALVFALFCAWDSVRGRVSWPLAALTLALLGPVVWLVIGRFEHGDPFFFIARVTAYRRALGADGASLMQRLAVYPALLLRAEPELWTLAGALLSVSFFGRGARGLRDYARPALALAALLAFMMLGSARDGVPTHHAARVLLPLWFAVCVACGQVFAAAFAVGSPQVRIHILGASVLGLAVGYALRPHLTLNEGFAERSDELSAGAEVRRRAPPGAELAVATADYGYFAILAAFGSPTRTRVLDDHDPRKTPPAAPGALATPSSALAQALGAQEARFVLVQHEHGGLLGARYAPRWQNAKFSLFERGPSP